MEFSKICLIHYKSILFKLNLSLQYFALTCCAHFALPTAPHLIGRQREDGDGVPTLHLPHHRVLTHSSQQLHSVNGWRKSKQSSFVWLSLWLCVKEGGLLTSLQDEAGVSAPVPHQLPQQLETEKHSHLKLFLSQHQIKSQRNFMKEPC